MNALRIALAVAVGALASWGWMEHSRRVHDEEIADTLSRAVNLADATLNPAYLHFQKQHRRAPADNVEAGLPPPVDPYWQGYDRVQLYNNGDVRFEFHQVGQAGGERYAFTWRSVQQSAPGSVTCAVRGIPLRVLERLRMVCNVEVADSTDPSEATSGLPHIPKPPPEPADQVLDAVSRDDPAALQRLQASGADLCEPDVMHRTAIAEAVRSNDLKVINQLLLSGCPIDAIEPATGRTPLMIASAGDDLHLVYLLLQNGANPGLRNAQGFTAWSLLPVGTLSDVTEEIRVRSTMLDKGVSVDAADDQGRTMLMLAAEAGGYDQVLWLLGRGARIDAQDNAGRTALMHAVTGSRGESALPALLHRGASLGIQDRQGLTALALAGSIADPIRRHRIVWMLSQH